MASNGDQDCPQHLLDAMDAESQQWNQEMGPAQNGRNQVMGPAQNEHNQGIGPAQNGLNQPMGPAQNGHNQGIGVAQNGLNQAMMPAQNGYNQAMAPAQNGHNQAMMPAQNGHNQAMAPAQNGHNQATMPAQNGPPQQWNNLPPPASIPAPISVPIPVPNNVGYVPNGIRPQHNSCNNGTARQNGYCPNGNQYVNAVMANGRMVRAPAWVTTNRVSNTKKQKRNRTAFSSQQMTELEQEYARTRYLERNRRSELSETLNLNQRVIKIWFQNRRMKEKKDRAESLESGEVSTSDSSPEISNDMYIHEQYPVTVEPREVYNNGMYTDPYSMPSTSTAMPSTSTAMPPMPPMPPMMQMVMQPVRQPVMPSVMAPTIPPVLPSPMPPAMSPVMPSSAMQPVMPSMLHSSFPPSMASSNHQMVHSSQPEFINYASEPIPQSSQMSVDGHHYSTGVEGGLEEVPEETFEPDTSASSTGSDQSWDVSWIRGIEDDF